jgi:hypothetical protein
MTLDAETTLEAGMLFGQALLELAARERPRTWPLSAVVARPTGQVEIVTFPDGATDAKSLSELDPVAVVLISHFENEIKFVLARDGLDPVAATFQVGIRNGRAVTSLPAYDAEGELFVENLLAGLRRHERADELVGAIGALRVARGTQEIESPDIDLEAAGRLGGLLLGDALAALKAGSTPRAAMIGAFETGDSVETTPLASADAVGPWLRAFRDDNPVLLIWRRSVGELAVLVPVLEREPVLVYKVQYAVGDGRVFTSNPAIEAPNADALATFSRGFDLSMATWDDAEDILADWGALGEYSDEEN